MAIGRAMMLWFLVGCCDYSL